MKQRDIPPVVCASLRTYYVQVTYFELVTKFSSTHLVELMSSKTLRCLAVVLKLFCISLAVPRGVNGCTGDAWYHVYHIIIDSRVTLSMI